MTKGGCRQSPVKLVILWRGRLFRVSLYLVHYLKKLMIGMEMLELFTGSWPAFLFPTDRLMDWWRWWKANILVLSTWEILESSPCSSWQRFVLSFPSFSPFCAQFLCSMLLLMIIVKKRHIVALLILVTECTGCQRNNWFERNHRIQAKYSWWSTQEETRY